MEGMTYLAVGYLGMLIAIALWTYTVVQRSQRLEARLSSMESVLDAGGQAQPLQNEDE
jgi:hypothetical protein